MAKIYPQIRVFVSSTFLDMQKEREILNLDVFPIVKGTCDKLGVAFNIIDLRWGITKEDQDRGSVLELCLDEIQHCKPYFIGLIGNRYGTILKDYDSDIEEKYPFIKENKDKSVTEMEMILGAISEENRERCFFYYKDPELFDKATWDNKDDMIDNLKNRINNLNIHNVNYSSFDSFRDSVLKDLMKAIKTDYPEESDISEIKQQNFLSLQESSFIFTPLWTQVNDVLNYVEDNHVAVAAITPLPSGKTIMFNHLINAKEKADKIIINFEADAYMRYFPAHYLYQMISDGLYDYGYDIEGGEEYPEPKYLNNYESSTQAMLSILKKALYTIKYKRPLYILINDVNLFNLDESKTFQHAFLFDKTRLPDNLYVIITTNEVPSTPITYIQIDSSMDDNTTKDFFINYISKYGKNIDAEIMKNATPGLNICYYKFIADFLIYYCNFSTYMETAKTLLSMHNHMDILTWIFDYFVSGMSPKCATVYTESLLRILTYAPGLSERTLFDSYNMDTALEKESGYHVYVELSEIEKATIMRALRFFTNVDSGTIYISNPYIKAFLEHSIEHLSEVLLKTNSEQTRKAYEEFFARVGNITHLMTNGQLWIKEDFINAESSGKGSSMIMNYALFDPLCTLLDSKLSDFTKELRDAKDAFNKQDLSDREVMILVTLQEAASIFAFNTRTDLYHKLLQNVRLMLFVCCKSHSLLRRLISGYIDLNIHIHETQFSHIDIKNISFAVNDAFEPMANADLDIFPENLIDDVMDIAIQVLKDYKMLDFDLLEYANDGYGSFTMYDFAINSCSDEVQKIIANLEIDSDNTEDDEIKELAESISKHFNKTNNAFDKLLYAYYFCYVVSTLIGKGEMDTGQIEDLCPYFGREVDRLSEYCFFPEVIESINLLICCL